jgi:hypothetical protein
MTQYYNEWTPMVMFSDHGDEVIRKGKYFVCVYADDDTGNKWRYRVQLPISGRCVYPGEYSSPFYWDNKEEAKQHVNSWDDSTFEALRKMDDNSERNEL